MKTYTYPLQKQRKEDMSLKDALCSAYGTSKLSKLT